MLYKLKMNIIKKIIRNDKENDKWKKMVNSTIPKNAIIAGRNCDNQEIYIGRVNHQNDLLPAKVYTRKNSNEYLAYVTYAGKETALSVNKNTVEIFCNNFVQWIPSCKGNVPKGAVPCGKNVIANEILYIGRTVYVNELLIGKISPSHRVLYIGFEGAEIPISDNYEILVHIFD